MMDDRIYDPHAPREYRSSIFAQATRRPARGRLQFDAAFINPRERGNARRWRLTRARNALPARASVPWSGLPGNRCYSANVGAFVFSRVLLVRLELGQDSSVERANRPRRRFSITRYVKYIPSRVKQSSSLFPSTRQLLARSGRVQRNGSREIL